MPRQQIERPLGSVEEMLRQQKDHLDEQVDEEKARHEGVLAQLLREQHAVDAALTALRTGLAVQPRAQRNGAAVAATPARRPMGRPRKASPPVRYPSSVKRYESSRALTVAVIRALPDAERKSTAGITRQVFPTLHRHGKEFHSNYTKIWTTLTWLVAEGFATRTGAGQQRLWDLRGTPEATIAGLPAPGPRVALQEA